MICADPMAALEADTGIIKLAVLHNDAKPLYLLIWIRYELIYLDHWHTVYPVIFAGFPQSFLQRKISHTQKLYLVLYLFKSQKIAEANEKKNYTVSFIFANFVTHKRTDLR